MPGPFIDDAVRDDWAARRGLLPEGADATTDAVVAGTDGLAAGTVQEALQALATRVAALEAA